jgi:O-antigen ligase
MVLSGAKWPWSFSLVFLSGTLLFLWNMNLSKKHLIPQAWLFPWVLLIGWGVITLMGLPPLAKQLHTISKWICYALFALLFLGNNQPKKASAWAWTVFFLGLVEALLLLSTAFLGHGLEGFLQGNPFYSALLISASFLFILAYYSKENFGIRKSWGMLLATTIIIIALCMSGSFSVLVGTLVMSLLFITHKKSRMLALLSVGILVLIILTMAPGLRVWLDWIKAPEWEQFYRLTIWSSALNAIPSHWLMGVGLGNFEQAYLQHQLPAHDILSYAGVTPFAHNDFLELTVEAGIPALLLLIWAIIVGLHLMPPVKRLHWTQRWALSVLGVFFICALFNFSLFLPANGILWAGCIGIMTTSFHSANMIDLKNPKFLRSTTIVALGFLSFSLLNGAADFLSRRMNNDALALKIMPIRADIWHAKAIRSLKSPRFPANPQIQKRIISELQSAVRWDPGHPYYWNDLGRWMHQMNWNTPRQTENALRQATLKAPGNAYFHIDLAEFYRSRNNIPQTVIELKKAIKLEPRAPVPVVALGSLYLDLGHHDQAREYLQEGLNLEQNFGPYIGPSQYEKMLFSINTESIEQVLKNL